MGACASKPKEFQNSPDSVPTEAPVSPKKPEPEPHNNAQEKNNGDENLNEAPLVDLSEPKKLEADVEQASAENKDESNTASEVTEKKFEAAIDKGDAPLVTL